MTAPSIRCTVELVGSPQVWVAASPEIDESQILNPFSLAVPPIDSEEPVLAHEFHLQWREQVVRHIKKHGHGGFWGWIRRIMDPTVVLTSSAGPQIFVRLIYDGTYLRRRYVAAQLNPKWTDVIRVEGAEAVEIDGGFTRFEFPPDHSPLTVVGNALKLYLCYGGPWFYAMHGPGEHFQTRLIQVRSAGSEEATRS